MSQSAFGTRIHASSTAPYIACGLREFLASPGQLRLVSLCGVVVHVELLSVLSHFTQGLSSFRASERLIVEEIDEFDPAMAPGDLVRNLSVFEELYQRWSTDAEQVGGILGCESLGPRSEGYRLAVAHGIDDANEDLPQRTW